MCNVPIMKVTASWHMNDWSFTCQGHGFWFFGVLSAPYSCLVIVSSSHPSHFHAGSITQVRREHVTCFLVSRSCVHCVLWLYSDSFGLCLCFLSCRPHTWVHKAVLGLASHTDLFCFLIPCFYPIPKNCLSPSINSMQSIWGKSTPHLPGRPWLSWVPVWFQVGPTPSTSSFIYNREKLGTAQMSH